MDWQPAINPMAESTSIAKQAREARGHPAVVVDGVMPKAFRRIW